MIQADKRAVFIVYRIEDHQYIAIDIYLTHLSIYKVSFHLFAAHLIVVNRIFLFHDQGLVNDMGPTDGAVVGINLHLLTQKLLFAMPNDGVAIHRHTRVLGVIDQ